MTTSEVSAKFQSAFVLSQTLFGIVTLAFNGLICLVILLDSDPRSKSYRKYLFLLQFFSTFCDACLWIYAPIFQANCRLVFTDSAASKAVRMLPGLMIYSVCIIEIGASYFMCVYYRRNQLLPRETRFCFHGWKYFMIPTLLQMGTVIGLSNWYHFLSVFSSSAEDEIPEIVSWVKQKPSFLFLQADRIQETIAICLVATIIICSGLIILMILQLIFAIRKMSETASVATKRYQSRAVFSLIMQGVVPTSFIIAPVAALTGIGLNSLSVGLETSASNSIAAVLSVLSLSVMGLHGFLHSLTIVACSPAYRKRIYGFLVKATLLTRICPLTLTRNKVTSVKAKENSFTSAVANGLANRF